MKTCAVLDIGTNSIKFYMAAVGKDKWETILDARIITRLGEALYETGEISRKAMARNVEAIKNFLEKAREAEVNDMAAVGTMCLREAKNAEVFRERVLTETGISVEVISAEEEARLSYLAVASELQTEKKGVIVFDSGGGSTELMFGVGSELNRKFSLNLGAVLLTERFLRSDPVTRQEFGEMSAYIMDCVKHVWPNTKTGALIGIGGTVTTMGAVMFEMKEYNPQRIHGAVITMDEVDRQVSMYLEKTIEERKSIAGLEPKRADIILAGAEIVKSIMERFDARSLTVSDRGLRHGVLFDRFVE